MTGTHSSDSDPVAAVRQRFTEAAKAGDTETLVSLFCEDAVLMAPNEPTLYGIQEVKEWWEEYFQHFKIVDLTETEHNVTLFDEGAVERLSYMIAIEPVHGGDAIRDEGRWLAVWQPGPGGIWRMKHGMFNSIQPIGSGTTRFFARIMERRKNV